MRKLGSPNAKKVVNCRSPNSKKTTSPQQQQQLPLTLADAQPTADTSNALQTARKLKKMLESTSPSAECDEPATKVPGDSAKRSNLKRAQATKPLKKQKRIHDETIGNELNEPGPSHHQPHAHEPEPTRAPRPTQETDAKVDAAAEAAEKISWSRDEDRLLLEEIKNGLDDNIENISAIAHRFPNKTADQLRDRVDFLIDFLTKLRDRI